MIWLKDFFRVDVDLLILAIGAYMAFVQGKNLTLEQMEREGKLTRFIGYFYLVIGIVGICILLT